MADVSVDATILAGAGRGYRSVVFTTESIGYVFYIDSDQTFGYSKTTDGGASWGAQVEVEAAASNLAFDVWFDQWTPGDSGTLIHMWFFDSTADDVYWRSLDTNGDTLGTRRVCFNGASAVAGVNCYVSGTKSDDGTLWCVAAIDASNEEIFSKSIDSGTTWSATQDINFQESNPDHALLFPAFSAQSTGGCMAVYHDSSATALTMKLFNPGDTTIESATIQTIIAVGTDLSAYQYPYSAAIRHSDGHLILVSCSERDSATGSMQVWDISAVGNGDLSGVTAKTDIATNIDDIYNPQVFIDQTNDHIYVAYNGKRDGSEVLGTTTKVYYTKSTDGGTSWTAGDTAYQEGATSANLQVWTPLSGHDGSRFYAIWRVGTTLKGNAVNSVPVVASVTRRIFVTGG